MAEEQQQPQKTFDPNDDAKYSMDNLDNLTEEEILEVARRYKEKNLPKWRLGALVAYNIVFGGVAMYFTMNYKYYTQKFFKPKRYNLMNIIKIGKNLTSKQL